MTRADQCVYFEVCKHFRGDEYETCKILSLCKFYLSFDKNVQVIPEKKKRRGRPPKHENIDDGFMKPTKEE